MTLEEKAAQMVCVWREKANKLVDADGVFDFQKAKVAFKKGHAPGQVGRPSDAGRGKNPRGMAELTNAIQKFFLENTRLGIPVVFHEECLHGHAAIGGTSFTITGIASVPQSGNPPDAYIPLATAQSVGQASASARLIFSNP